eukprot:3565716-Alexandrium_andersonii.AAC.1
MCAIGLPAVRRNRASLWGPPSHPPERACHPPPAGLTPPARRARGAIRGHAVARQPDPGE